MTALGDSFRAAVRKEFSSIFQRFGFIEVGEESNLNFATVVVKNATHYLRVGCDFRDRTVYASIGRLSEGLVPPFPIAPSRTPEDVREIGDAILTWLATVTGMPPLRRAFIQIKRLRRLLEQFVALPQWFSCMAGACSPATKSYGAEPRNLR